MPGTSHQNIFNRIMDELDRGLITVEEANIRQVEDYTIYVVNCSLPREFRSNIMKAVKKGRLGRLKKEDGEPEIFYKAGFEFAAKEKRVEIKKQRMRIKMNFLVYKENGEYKTKLNDK